MHASMIARPTSPSVSRRDRGPLGCRAVIAAVALAAGGPAFAQVPAAPVRLAPATVRVAAEVEPPAMSAEEVEQLRGIYDTMTPEDQADLIAAYEQMGIDLLALFGEGTGAGADAVGADVSGGAPLLQLVQQKDFKRTPQAVLASRTALGLERTERPAEDAPNPELAEWLHRQVMAGEWGQFAWFVSERGGDDASAIYAHVLQSTNQGDPMLLPEEVLAMADAAPTDPPGWQIDVLAQLLKTASARTSTGPMLAQLESGTRLFGNGDPVRRRRTADLLMKAGMPIEAYAYLPPLGEARMNGDIEVVLGHGLYHLGRMDEARGPAVDVERRRAFMLFAEVVLFERPVAAEEPEPAGEPVTDGASTPESESVPVAAGAAPSATAVDVATEDAARRSRALDLAMDMLPDIPESIASPWLDQVFRRESLAPAALELIALDAMTLSDRKLDQAQRARAILIMKTAVDSLLDNERVDREALRVPLRMLTTGLVTEAEKVADARPDPRRGNSRPGTAMLLRALPDQRWLDTIEPSLAVRAYRAFIAVATVADETDLALDVLERGMSRHPGQARDLAGTFLGRWAGRLRPNAGNDQNAAMQAAFIIFGGRTSVPAAPLTRGRQARNLERLTRVIALMGEIGADAREVPEVVDAFRACHSAAEAFTAADIERVLGSIEELPGPTAATLATAMRSGLAGDWRSRETQQRFGMRRNATEIGEVVADGYGVAMRLIDRAIAVDPASWDLAVIRAALAFDRLEHRRSQRGDDFAEYEELRRQSFDAFEAAADRYAASAADGGVPVSIQVHLAWFNAAVGATQLNQLTRDNILFEGSERDTQIDRIREAIDGMRPDQAEAHVAAFVREITSSLSSVNPEVKPRLVRHALRVVGDHPLGAPLRRIAGVHDDLIDNEIALRLAIDGDDRIGAGDAFGVVLSLRYTNAVDRETDGFSKYLRNAVWVYFGNSGRTVDYRDRLEQSIERSLEESFDVQSIAFFDPLYPSREVREGGDGGWQEKPLAYLVLAARDPSLERVPPVRMDLDFVDTTGPVILTVESNAPAVDAATSGALRPVRSLSVSQTLDARGVDSSRAADELVLEVRASGRGVLPDLDGLLTGLEGAVDGYSIPEDGIETHPVNVLSQPDATDDPFGFTASASAEDEAAMPGPDADGTYRTDFERSWTIRFVPDGARRGREFRVPTFADGAEGEMEVRYFDDLDIVPAASGVIPLDGRGLGFSIMIGIIAASLTGIVVAVGLSRLRIGGADEEAFEDLVPAHATPLAVVTAMRRIADEHGSRLPADARSELAGEIRELETRFFGRASDGVAGDADGLDGRIRAWVERLRRG